MHRNAVGDNRAKRSGRSANTNPWVGGADRARDLLDRFALLKMARLIDQSSPQPTTAPPGKSSLNGGQFWAPKHADIVRRARPARLVIFYP